MTFRQKRSAAYIDAAGPVSAIQRVPFMDGSYNEAWLQELIADNPSLLPCEEFSSDYTILVCIGREVAVGAGDAQGYIDNLYVTPSGGIVVVETKLFRNQESRRTVVAQIIDYAKELQKLDAEKLDKICGEYFYAKEGQSCRIIDVMARFGLLKFSDEAAFTDALNCSLSSASFLLLIVGDGIRTNVQQLAGFLNENTSMSFRLGLVELEIYQVPTGTVVIPNLITKATTIERHIASYFDDEYPPMKKSDYISPPILSRKDFIERFADNGGYDPDLISEFIYDIDIVSGVTIRVAPTELTIRFSPDEAHSYPLLTFGISGGKADVWVKPSQIEEGLECCGFFHTVAAEYLEFYRDYIDIQRCRHTPYDFRNGHYYADVQKMARSSVQFVQAIEAFIKELD